MSVITTRPAEVLQYHADLTAAHLHPNELLTAYTANFMDSIFRKSGREAAVSMFHPIISTDTARIVAKHGEMQARQIGRDLTDATTYEVTSEMITAMAALMGRTDEAETLEQAELPGESGWAWFDDGWPLRDVRGEVYTIRAVSWRFLTAFVDGTESHAFLTPANWPCVRVVLWVHVNDDAPEHRHHTDNEVGKLQMVHAAVVPFGIPMKVPPELRGKAESFINLVHMLWMFLGMEITATRRPKIQNYYRKRALRSLLHGEVHVVMLRRVRYSSDAPDVHRHIDWQARWVVQGHHRHLTNPLAQPGTAVHRAVSVGGTCAVCGGQLTYVRAYVKGPDGLPLKVSRTLMKLAR